MKPVGSFWKLTLVGTLATAMSFAASAQAAMKNEDAVVRNVQGTASYSKNDSAWKTLEVGQRLGAGSAVRTGVSSMVDLYMEHTGPVVRAMENSQLGVDKLSYDQTAAETIVETQLNLSTGRILGSVKQLTQASSYEVRIPVGVVGVRSGEYDISADGTVHMITGSAVVAYINTQDPNNPTIVTVNAGQTAHPPVQPGQKAVVDATPGDYMTQNQDLWNDFNGVVVSYPTSPNPAPPGGPTIVREIPGTSKTTTERIPFVSPTTGVLPNP